MVLRPNELDKKPCVSKRAILHAAAVLELVTTATIQGPGPKHVTGRAESGDMEFKPYQQVMAELAKQTPPPVPQATVRNQPVNIPGVFNQSLNMLKPVNTEELYKGRDQ